MDDDELRKRLKDIERKLNRQDDNHGGCLLFIAVLCFIIFLRGCH